MPDYIFMLQSRLSPEQWQVVNRLQDFAQTIPVNLYLVGGAVRDLMTGSPIRDLDFTVEGNVQKLLQVFRKEELPQSEWDEVRRSAELVLENGIACNLEMARIEIHEEPRKPPVVRPASILEDLRRRDFSINAIGISLNPGSRGLLLDPTNGLADIETRTLRVLHNYSFLHHPVRLLRLVRFSTRLGFTLEGRTQGLFEVAREKGYARLIPPADARREMIQLTREDNPVPVLKAWQRYELLSVFHQQLQRRGPDYEGLAKLQKYRQAVQSAGYAFDSFAMVLYYVLRRLQRAQQLRLLRNLAIGGKEARKLLDFEREARKVAKPLTRQRMANPRHIYAYLEPLPLELLVFILTLFSPNKKIQSKVHNYLFRYRPLRQQLPVRELELLGVPHGPAFDHILEQFFYARLAGKLRNRTEQIRFLRKLGGVGKPVRKKVKKQKARKKQAIRKKKKKGK